MISFEKDGVEYRFFDHLYAVSACGKALRKLTPFLPGKRRDGYLTLGRRRLMHRVVATCWIPNEDNKHFVHHINHDRSDNRAENLEWVTPKEHWGDRHHKATSYIRSDATRKKYSLLRLGKKDSDATKEKKRASLAAYQHLISTKCKFNGVEFPSLAAGAKAAGIKYGTFITRCRSKNFPEYEYLLT
jgi:hypothetical protein